LLTSSFPCSPDDQTCGYIRDFARSLSVQFNVTVLAPPDRSALQWPPDEFALTRSWSVLPARLDPFSARADLNHLVSANLFAKIATLVSLVCFFVSAMRLAFRCDAICSHWMVPSGFVGSLINRLVGKPHVVVEHSGAVHLLTRMRGGKRVARFIVAGSDRVATVSSDLERKLISLCPASRTRVSVVPMGVTLAPTPADSIPITREPRKILFIGRLTEIKGVDVLLRAMTGLGNLSLLVAGDGERRGELERLASKLSVSARFIGRIGASEREQLLSICDLVVIPSRVLADGRTEGMPVVCVEAMAAGCVVVASRVGGLADAIVDGENGLLFEQGDHLMLKHKLSLALTDDILRKRISENARRSAVAYEWARVGSRYGDIIKSALRKKEAIGNRTIEARSFRG
jgi:glycosyltransferase involved in cell wall biosynthesis